MTIEKTKNDLVAELDSLRSGIDAKKAERKALAEREKAILAEAKEKGISLSPEKTTRGTILAETLLSQENGFPFTVPEIARLSNENGKTRGMKDNLSESETVFRNNVSLMVRFGIIEKTGKDSYRLLSIVSGKKIVNG